MENFDHQEYRDELAGKLKGIRNSDPENVEKAHAKAGGYLDAEKEKTEYEKAEELHRKEAIENMPFNMATFEQYVDIKKFTVDELVELISSGYDRNKQQSKEELKNIVQDALVAIEHIKENGLILRSSELKFHINTASIRFIYLSESNGYYHNNYKSGKSDPELVFLYSKFKDDLNKIKMLIDSELQNTTIPLFHRHVKHPSVN
jgi:hypothetical protein